jgi:Mg-chelatase subunit ChlD
MDRGVESRGLRLVGPIDGHSGRAIAHGAIRLDPAGRANRPIADVVLVIDTTGSMEDKIAGLLASCATFAARLADRGIDWRIAIVAFGDLRVRGDRIVATGYSPSLEVTRRALARIPRFDGGANGGESSLDALERAARLEVRQGAQRVAVLLTDDSPIEHGNLSVRALAERLRTDEVVTFTVAPDLAAYRYLAQRTGGQWFRISAEADLSAILAIFDRVASSVASTVSAIAVEAGGDLERFLLDRPRDR